MTDRSASEDDVNDIVSLVRKLESDRDMYRSELADLVASTSRVIGKEFIPLKSARQVLRDGFKRFG